MNYLQRKATRMEMFTVIKISSQKAMYHTANPWKLAGVINLFYSRIPEAYNGYSCGPRVMNIEYITIHTQPMVCSDLLLA